MSEDYRFSLKSIRDLINTYINNLIFSLKDLYILNLIIYFIIILN